MNEFDVIYLKILHHGLRAIRDATFASDLDWVRAESEHLHNLPSLIGESNIHRHLYYASKEKGAYLRWVYSGSRRDVIDFVESFYARNWEELDKALQSQSQKNTLGNEAPIVFR
jgi:hypothetical protein